MRPGVAPLAPCRKRRGAPAHGDLLLREVRNVRAQRAEGPLVEARPTGRFRCQQDSDSLPGPIGVSIGKFGGLAKLRASGLMGA
eukprot:2217368-Pyramimonas_sp.AAC.1